MSYRIEVSPAANRELRKLPAEIRDSLIRRLGSLGATPRPADAKKLSSSLKLWRIREENYRLIYQIRDDHLLIIVVRAGHRKEVYRQLSRLLQSTKK